MDVEQLAKPKHSWFTCELQAHIMKKRTNYSQVQVVHIYCDGSIDAANLVVTCSSITTLPLLSMLTLKFQEGFQIMSSTRAELYGSTCHTWGSPYHSFP